MFPAIETMSDDDQVNFRQAVEAIIDQRLACSATASVVGPSISFCIVASDTAQPLLVFAAFVGALFLSCIYICAITALAAFTLRQLPFSSLSQADSWHNLAAFLAILTYIFITILPYSSVVNACIFSALHLVIVSFLILGGRSAGDQAWATIIRLNEEPQLPLHTYRFRATPCERILSKCVIKIRKAWGTVSTAMILVIHCLAAAALCMAPRLAGQLVTETRYLSFAIVVVTSCMLLPRSRLRLLTTAMLLEWCLFFLISRVRSHGIGMGNLPGAIDAFCFAGILIAIIVVTLVSVRVTPSDWWNDRLDKAVCRLLGRHSVNVPQGVLLRKCVWFCTLGSRKSQEVFADAFSEWHCELSVKSEDPSASSPVGSVTLTRFLCSFATERVRQLYLVMSDSVLWNQLWFQLDRIRRKFTW